MDFNTILIIWAVVVIAIVFLVARLAIRWALRMVIVGVILIAIVGGGFFWWWTTRLAPKPPAKPRPAPTRRSQS